MGRDESRVPDSDMKRFGGKLHQAFRCHLLASVRELPHRISTVLPIHRKASLQGMPHDLPVLLKGRIDNIVIGRRWFVDKLRASRHIVCRNRVPMVAVPAAFLAPAHVAMLHAAQHGRIHE